MQIISKSGFKRNNPRTMFRLKFSSAASLSIRVIYYSYPNEPTNARECRVDRIVPHSVSGYHLPAFAAFLSMRPPRNFFKGSNQLLHTHRPTAMKDIAGQFLQQLHLH